MGDGTNGTNGGGWWQSHLKKNQSKLTMSLRVSVSQRAKQSPTGQFCSFSGGLLGQKMHRKDMLFVSALNNPSVITLMAGRKQDFSMRAGVRKFLHRDLSMWDSPGGSNQFFSDVSQP